ncbi:MAG TPA: hypothetical protein VGR30_04350 [Candidatus Binatia bacterium]|nr:hypothetical protein [Candidatus Binatia bacterium]
MSDLEDYDKILEDRAKREREAKLREYREAMGDIPQRAEKARQALIAFGKDRKLRHGLESLKKHDVPQAWYYPSKLQELLRKLLAHRKQALEQLEQAPSLIQKELDAIESRGPRDFSYAPAKLVDRDKAALQQWIDKAETFEAGLRDIAALEKEFKELQASFAARENQGGGHPLPDSRGAYEAPPKMEAPTSRLAKFDPRQE